MKSFYSDKEQKLSKACLINIGGISYSVIMGILKKKDIKVNGKRVNKDILLNPNDKVEVYIKEDKKEFFSAIFEDENILVINKKAGYTSENVFDRILEKKKEAYFIHRLDKNTSGIMVFALNKQAEQELLFGFKNRTFIKEYRCEVYGFLDKKEDVLEAFLLKDSVRNQVKIYDKFVKDSVPIKTGYKVIEKKEKTSILSVKLYTGKTHQIRAHLAHIGHFIVGDGKYGNDTFNREMKVKEQQLCSYKLTLHFDEKSKLNYLDNRTFEI